MPIPIPTSFAGSIAARARVLAAVVATLLLVAPAAEGGAGAVHTFRSPNPSAPGALSLTVDARWVDGSGYRPVRIKLATAGNVPSPADRSFRVELRPTLWDWSLRRAVVAGSLELPQGAREAAATVSLPQNCPWGQLHLDLYEDGQRRDDLSGGFNLSNLSHSWSEAIPRVLVIDRDAPGWAEGKLRANWSEVSTKLPDIRGFALQLRAMSSPFEEVAMFTAEGVVSDAAIWEIVSGLPWLEMLPPSELPERWIDWTCFDLAVISRAELADLAAQLPSRWSALQDWIRAGNTLLVYEQPPDEAQLAALGEHFGLAADGPAADRRTSRAGWGQASPVNATAQLRGVPELDNGSPADAEGPSRLRKIAPGERGELWFRQLGLGRVFAASSADPFAADAIGLAWTLNELGEDRWMWCQRHGMSLHRANRDFGTWLIPGVGRTPVRSYLALITLFVLAIGPLNYFLLRKWKRLYLLLITVPLGAGLVSLALVNYALLSDGLGVRARIRGYTEIDQRAGRAVSWSRHTYYAGLAPSRGLAFPADATVFPLQLPASMSSADRSPRLLVWDERQRLARGYLPARTTTQFLAVRSGKSDRGLIVRGEDEEAGPVIENGLGVRLDHVLIRAADGRFLLAKSVPDGARLRPSPVTAAAAAAVLTAAHGDNLPRFPRGYEGSDDHYGNRFHFVSLGRLDHSLPQVSIATSCLEVAIREALSGDPSRLPPRSYLATAKGSPEAPIAAEGAREEGSFHVIRGHW